MSVEERIAHPYNGLTHPAASKFRLLDGQAFDDLCDDILERGQLDPIWLDPDGYLLDGRNRKRACDHVGIEPVYDTYYGDDPVGFIRSKNVKRRHLTVVEQRAERKEETARKHAEGKTTRQIAAEHGVSHVTVQNDLGDVVSDLPHPRVVDALGRSQPARKATAAELSERRAYVIDQFENHKRSRTDLAKELGVSYSSIKNYLRATSTIALVPEPRPKGKDAVSVRARAERIRELAAAGNTSHQIARIMDLSESGVAHIAARHGIELTTIRQRRINHDKIVEALVQRVAFDYMTDSTAAVLDYSALTRENVADWVSSLTISIASLKQLLKHLKELTQ